jgi:hypothetical protein
MVWTHRCALLSLCFLWRIAEHGEAEQPQDSQSELEGVDPPSSEGQDEEEEVAAAAGLRVPKCPSEAEKRNHERTHLPFSFVV